jgi:drug/metabolite transporter (DMT)-like permease
MWALDNNLTRHLSARNPFVIARLKGLCAGCTTLLAAVVLGYSLPATGAIGFALLLGAFSYGASLVLFVYALRHLGAARTGAFFGTAPFIGGTVALIVLAEPLTWTLGAAGVLMAVGVWLILREAHEHEHAHDDLCHEHLHTHDEHHRHEHPECEDEERHSHEHAHRMLAHTHAHVPDLHHRHGH